MNIFKRIMVIAPMMLSITSLTAVDQDVSTRQKGPVLMSTKPEIDGYGYHIEAGFLFEQMYFRGGIAANSVDSSLLSDPSVTFPNVGQARGYVPYRFDLTPGLRVCVAKYFDYDDWKVSADFEWMYSKDSIKRTGDSTHGYNPSLGALFGEYHYTALKATLTTDYYLLDIYLSRGAYLSEKVSLIPFAGVKAAWFYIDGVGDFTGNTKPASESAYEQKKSRFWGVGPVIGLNSNYTFYHGWSIYNDTNLSVLIGNAKNSKGLWLDLTPSGTTDAVNATFVDYNAFTICPTIRSSLGLQYETTFNKDTIAGIIKVGFDARYYFNQFPLMNYGEFVPGSWGMMGLIITLGLDF